MLHELEQYFMSAEEKKASDDAQEAIEEAKEKFKESEEAGDFKIYIRWVNEKYVPEAKRKALPNVEPGIKFVRWITLNVMKHVHPDKFVNASKAK